VHPLRVLETDPHPALRATQVSHVGNTNAMGVRNDPVGGILDP